MTSSVYATLTGKVYRFTPDRWERFLWRWTHMGEMPDVEKAGKLVGEGIVEMDDWTLHKARNQLVAIISGKAETPKTTPSDELVFGDAKPLSGPRKL